MKKLLYLFLIVLCLCGCQNQSDVIKTQYFQVQVPISWNELYEYEVYTVDNNVYSLIFYDKASHQTDFGGHVVTLSVYYLEDEYDFLPSYEYLGVITNNDKYYVIISEFPTDVQFDVSTQDSYMKLASSYEPIIESIKGINGYTFTMK